MSSQTPPAGVPALDPAQAAADLSAIIGGPVIPTPSMRVGRVTPLTEQTDAPSVLPVPTDYRSAFVPEGGISEADRQAVGVVSSIVLQLLETLDTATSRALDQINSISAAPKVVTSATNFDLVAARQFIIRSRELFHTVVPKAPEADSPKS